MTQEDKNSQEQVREYLVLDPDSIQRSTAGDDISLLDLWAILARKRILIFGILAASLVTSVVIAYLTAPVYQATVHFQPQKFGAIEELDIPVYDSKDAQMDAFNKFQRNFMDRENLLDFFIRKQLYKAYLNNHGNADTEIANTFEKKFLKDIRLHEAGKGKGNLTATLNWKDAAEGAALLNEYSQEVIRKSTDQLVNKLNKKLLLRKEKIQTKIDLLRDSQQRATNDRLARLDEDINIAKELGIKRGKGLVEWHASNLIIDASVNQSTFFRGYEGYEVLEAEKRILQARKNNDPFTPGLNEELEELEYLDSIKIPDDLISVARMTSQATTALSPRIKPRKKLVIVIGGVFGLFLGVFMAFMSHAVSRQRALLNKG